MKLEFCHPRGFFFKWLKLKFGWISFKKHNKQFLQKPLFPEFECYENIEIYRPSFWNRWPYRIF